MQNNMAKVPLVSEGLDNDEIELICSSFKSGMHTMGQEVLNFESKFAEYVGTKYAVMVNSGSSANLLALETLTWKNRINNFGKLVAVPAVLWPTTIWPVVQLGYKALIVDTLPNSLEIDLNKLEAALIEKKGEIAGAILIHPLGASLNLGKVAELKDKYGIFVIEDNCESLGAGFNNQFAGSIGDFGTFSFYYSHHMTTVEGGMVVTNSEENYNNLLSIRAHGWVRNRLDKEALIERKVFDPRFYFVTPGFNLRPMEFQGIVGQSQLLKLNHFLRIRLENASYLSKVSNKTFLRVIGSNVIEEDLKRQSPPYLNSWMAFPLINLRKDVETNSIQNLFEENGIATRPLLAGNFIDQPAGSDPQIVVYENLKNSKQLYNNSFMVGNHHSYSKAQIDILVEAFLALEEKFS